MASISLYRKYRSQTFAEVVGQHHITDTLAQAVVEDRLHHAYLFTGPRGTGKTSTARILAKSLNCESGPTAQPCNTCTHCTSITSGSHVDVIEIDAASHGGIDDVRDLRDRVAFAPAQARIKVYIVDECHMLSTAGWNAFLKTLEEPPGHVMFVFATTEPHKVLDTILSRTQRFDFKRIDAPALSALAADLAGREGIELDDGALDLVVRAGDGSARDTLSVLDQVVAFTGKQVTAAGVAQVLGSTPSELLAEMADRIAEGNVAEVCGLVARAADAGHDLRQFARDIVEHLRSLFLLKIAPDAGLVAATPERLESMRAQAAGMGRTELLRSMELLSDAQSQMRRGVTRLSLEIALAKAAMPDACGDPGALAARLDRLERGEVEAQAPRADESSPAEELPGADAPSPAEELPPAAASPPDDASPPADEPPPAEELPPAAASPPDDASPLADEPPPADEPMAHSRLSASKAAPTAPSQAVESTPPTAPTEPTRTTESTGTTEPAAPTAPTPPPEPAAPPAASPTSGALDFEQVEQAWDAILETVKKAKIRFHAFLSMSHPVALDEQVLTLEFRPGYGLHAEQCGSPTGQEVIGAAFERVLGVRPRLHCVVGENDRPSRVRSAARKPDPAVAEADAVAENEESSAAASTLDDDATHDQAIERLRTELGATVVEDERP